MNPSPASSLLLIGDSNISLSFSRISIDYIKAVLDDDYKRFCDNILYYSELRHQNHADELQSTSEELRLYEAQLETIAMGRKQAQQSAADASPKQWRSALPFHVIQEILDYIEQTVIICSNSGDYDLDEYVDECITSEEQLWGRFAADPTRKPIFLWRSLLLKRPSESVEPDDDGSIMEESMVYSVLRQVRYLYLDLSLYAFAKNMLCERTRTLAKNYMPQLRKITSFPLLVGESTQQGTQILTNKYINDRITGLVPFSFEADSADFSKFLPLVPNVQHLYANSYRNFWRSELEATNACTQLKDIRISFIASDAKIIEICRHMTMLTLKFVRDTQDLAADKQALLQVMPKASASLKHLAFSAEYDVSIKFEELPVCSSLRSLCLMKNVSMGTETLAKALLQMPLLTSLTLDEISVKQMLELRGVSMHLECLELYQIKDCWGSDENTEATAESFGVLLELIELRPLRRLRLQLQYLDEIRKIYFQDYQHWVDVVLRLVRIGSKHLERLSLRSYTYPDFADTIRDILKLLRGLPQQQDRKLRSFALEDPNPNGRFLFLEPQFALLAEAFGLEELRLEWNQQFYQKECI